MSVLYNKNRNKSFFMTKLCLCRLCGNVYKTTLPHHLFRGDQELVIKIQAVTSISVLSTDPLPKYICNVCHLRLDLSYAFRKQCIASQIKLKDVLQNKSYHHGEKKSWIHKTSEIVSQSDLIPFPKPHNATRNLEDGSPPSCGEFGLPNSSKGVCKPILNHVPVRQSDCEIIDEVGTFPNVKLSANSTTPIKFPISSHSKEAAITKEVIKPGTKKNVCTSHCSSNVDPELNFKNIITRWKMNATETKRDESAPSNEVLIDDSHSSQTMLNNPLSCIQYSVTADPRCSPTFVGDQTLVDSINGKWTLLLSGEGSSSDMLVDSQTGKLQSAKDSVTDEMLVNPQTGELQSANDSVADEMLVDPKTGELQPAKDYVTDEMLVNPQTGEQHFVKDSAMNGMLAAPQTCGSQSSEYSSSDIMAVDSVSVDVLQCKENMPSEDILVVPKTSRMKSVDTSSHSGCEDLHDTFCTAKPNEELGHDNKVASHEEPFYSGNTHTSTSPIISSDKELPESQSNPMPPLTICGVPFEVESLIMRTDILEYVLKCASVESSKIKTKYSSDCKSHRPKITTASKCPYFRNKTKSPSNECQLESITGTRQISAAGSESDACNSSSSLGIPGRDLAVVSDDANSSNTVPLVSNDEEKNDIYEVQLKDNVNLEPLSVDNPDSDEEKFDVCKTHLEVNAMELDPLPVDSDSDEEKFDVSETHLEVNAMELDPLPVDNSDTDREEHDVSEAQLEDIGLKLETSSVNNVDVNKDKYDVAETHLEDDIVQLETTTDVGEVNSDVPETQLEVNTMELEPLSEDNIDDSSDVYMDMLQKPNYANMDKGGQIKQNSRENLENSKTSSVSKQKMANRNSKCSRVNTVKLQTIRSSKQDVSKSQKSSQMPDNSKVDQIRLQIISSKNQNNNDCSSGSVFQQQILNQSSKRSEVNLVRSQSISSENQDNNFASTSKPQTVTQNLVNPEANALNLKRMCNKNKDNVSDFTSKPQIENTNPYGLKVCTVKLKRISNKSQKNNNSDSVSVPKFSCNNSTQETNLIANNSEVSLLRLQRISKSEDNSISASVSARLTNPNPGHSEVNTTKFMKITNDQYISQTSYSTTEPPSNLNPLSSVGITVRPQIISSGNEENCGINPQATNLITKILEINACGPRIISTKKQDNNSASNSFSKLHRVYHNSKRSVFSTVRLQTLNSKNQDASTSQSKNQMPKRSEFNPVRLQKISSNNQNISNASSSVSQLDLNLESTQGNAIRPQKINNNQYNDSASTSTYVYKPRVRNVSSNTPEFNISRLENKDSTIFVLKQQSANKSPESSGDNSVRITRISSDNQDNNHASTSKPLTVTQNAMTLKRICNDNQDNNHASTSKPPIVTQNAMTLKRICSRNQDNGSASTSDYISWTECQNPNRLKGCSVKLKRISEKKPGNNNCAFSVPELNCISSVQKTSVITNNSMVSSLRLHGFSKQTQDNSANTSVSESQVHKCLRGGKSFSREHYLKKHIKVNYKPKFIFCKHCKKSFTDMKAFAIHTNILCKARGIEVAGLRAKIRDKILIFTCRECGRKFTLVKRLEDHVKAHKANKLGFTCKFCGKMFEHALSLKKHVDHHKVTGNKLKNT